MIITGKYILLIFEKERVLYHEWDSSTLSDFSAFQIIDTREYALLNAISECLDFQVNKVRIPLIRTVNLYIFNGISKFDADVKACF